MLNVKRKQLDVLFSLRIPVDDQMRKFRFPLPISLISYIYKTKDNTGQPSLVIPFDSTPCFYMQKIEGEDLGDGRKQPSFSRTNKIWSDWDTWYRVTDIVDGAIRAVLRPTPVMNYRDTAIIDIGRWTNYRLIFDNSSFSGLRTMGWTSKISLTILPSGKSLRRCGVFCQRKSTAHLSFPVRYQLEVCLSNGYIKEHNITIAFLKKLEALESQQAVHILEKVADRQKIYYDSMEIFDIPIKGIKRKMPSYCLLRRLVTITPTMMHVATPVMETSNRIIRKYEADANRFIRVRFTDEKNEGQLRNQPNAFGNSQFRENGAYFYAPTLSKSANDIRMSLGEFDHIKTVSKFAARLGQCFSTTRAMGVTVELTTTPDKKHNNFIFTDGVGKLSPFLAQMAAQELGLVNAFTDPPSLFQFRLGGSKGVVR
ncbi:RNA dependent RNA polymerase-domain-containing protein [Bipolaris maydis]|nr:RNA dependent RNA polymerase-domain-containing protein [Bipolaris maydis]